jgi:DNA-binding transcriptional MerR regulator
LTLKPARGESGYRLYRDSDLDRLEQILALKLLGIPLKQINDILDRGTGDLGEALRLQRTALEEKKRMLGSAIAAIEEAEQALVAGQESKAVVLRKVIEVISMQSNSDWMMKYYNDEARAKVEDRKSQWSPELQARVEREWADLYRDAEAAQNEDPSGPVAQALVDRWRALIDAFTGGDTQIEAGLKAMYADRPNWPTRVKAMMAPFSNQPAQEFLNKAIAARRR